MKKLIITSLVSLGIVAFTFNYVQASSLKGVNVTSTQHQKTIKSMDEGVVVPGPGPGGGEMGGLGGAGGGFGNGGTGAGGGGGRPPTPYKVKNNKHNMNTPK
jgi:hypothetical protein